MSGDDIPGAHAPFFFSRCYIFLNENYTLFNRVGRGPTKTERECIMKKFFAMIMTLVISFTTIATPAMAVNNPFDWIKETVEDYVPQLRNDSFEREFTTDDGVWTVVVKKNNDLYQVKATTNNSAEMEVIDNIKMKNQKIYIEFDLTDWNKDVENDIRTNGLL